MMVGYAIFGSASQPLILNNFARSQDGLASVSRLAIGFAIACAYPLMFAGAKSSMCNLLHLPLDTSSPKKNLLISAVVAAVLAVAIQCGEEEVSLVLGIVGSVLGCFVAYILPGMLDLAYMRCTPSLLHFSNCAVPYTRTFTAIIEVSFIQSLI